MMPLGNGFTLAVAPFYFSSSLSSFSSSCFKTADEWICFVNKFLADHNYLLRAGDHNCFDRERSAKEIGSGKDVSPSAGGNDMK